MSSSSATKTPEEKAALAAKLAKGAAILGLGFVVAPYIFTAITGLTGLLIAGAIMGVTWMVLPWLGDKAANTRLKLIKAEAAQNPVETLELEHRRQSILLDERKKGIETMSGGIRTLKDTIVALQTDFPDSAEIPQLMADYDELVALEQSRMADWQEAYLALGDFSKEIRKVSRLWDVANAAAKARKQSGLTAEDWNAKMKKDTAIESVRTKLNTQLSALNVEKMQAEADRLLKGKAVKNVTPAASSTGAALPAPRNMVNPEVDALRREASKQTLS